MGDGHDATLPSSAGITNRSAAAARNAFDAASAPVATGADDFSISSFFSGSSVVSTSLFRALSFLFGAIAAGSLVGFANPVFWAVRRAARRAKRVAAAATLQNGGGVTSAGRGSAGAGTGGGSSEYSHGSFAAVVQSASAGLARRSDRCGAFFRAFWRLSAIASARIYTWSDRYLQISHKYAYPVVAGQGRGWFKASKAVWRAFSRSGVDALIDDDVTDRLLLAGGYVGGILLTLMLGFSIAGQERIVDENTTSGIDEEFGSTPAWVWLSAALAVFAIGFTSVTLPLTLLESSVSTLFVTFARLPQAIAVLHPVVAHRWARLVEVHKLAAASTRLSSIASITDDTLQDDL